MGFLVTGPGRWEELEPIDRSLVSQVIGSAGISSRSPRMREVLCALIYALHVGADVWVIHAFQKKSKSGIKTPQPEIDLIRERLKRLREMLK